MPVAEIVLCLALGTHHTSWLPTKIVHALYLTAMNGGEGNGKQRIGALRERRANVLNHTSNTNETYYDLLIHSKKARTSEANTSSLNMLFATSTSKITRQMSIRRCWYIHTAHRPDQNAICNNDISSFISPFHLHHDEAQCYKLQVNIQCYHRLSYTQSRCQVKFENTVLWGFLHHSCVKD